MSQTIKVQIKNSYGNTLIYPVCDIAKMFTQLTGNKTLRVKDIEIIKKLGFAVEQVQPETMF